MMRGRITVMGCKRYKVIMLPELMYRHELAVIPAFEELKFGHNENH